MHARDWRDHALCLDQDTDLFFPIGLSGPSERQVAAAKAVCAGCSVSRPCLDWALSAGEVDGVWGGTTPLERRDLLRSRAATLGSRP